MKTEFANFLSKKITLTQQSVEGHEKQKKYGDVVNLMAGPFQDLVDSGFWHGKLQKDSNETNHNQWSWTPQHGQK